jgi:hypothetical protein
MFRKKTPKKERELFDTQALKTAEDVEQAQHRTREEICRKVQQWEQLNQARGDQNASFREQLGEMKEEIDYRMGVLDCLQSRLREIQGDQLLASAPNPS